VLSTLRFSRNGELSYLAALKRDEGSMFLVPMTLSVKLTLGRKEVCGK